MSASAVRVPIFLRSGTTLPLPSGCRRLQRNIRNVFELGSIQADVPVKPVCPKEPIGK